MDSCGCLNFSLRDSGVLFKSKCPMPVLVLCKKRVQDLNQRLEDVNNNGGGRIK
jgi:hypothetical protein